jgi:hypothetical protein
MIRPFTCLCLAAACGSGLYLYSEKHRTVMLDRDIAGVIRATEAARARTGLLRAEWSLLNEPTRLQDMANKYLALKPMAPTQFVQIADLPDHLPPPETAAEAQASTDAEDADGTPPATPATGIPGQTTAQQTPPAVVSEAVPPRPATDPKLESHAIPKILAHVEPKQKQPHHVALADRQYVPHDGMLAHGTPLPLAAPQPVGARVYSAVARPLPQVIHPPVVAAVPRYEPPFVGSALGGRPSLPPPTPYGAQ